MSRREMAGMPVLVFKDQRSEQQNRYQQIVAFRRQFEDRFQALARPTFDAAFECPIRKEGAEFGQAVAGALQPLIGFSSQEVEAPEGWEQLVHPDDHAVVAAHVQRVLGGQRDLCVFRVFTPARAVCWFGVLTRPVWDASGRRIGQVYGLVQDYSVRLEAPLPCEEADAAHSALPHIVSPSGF